MNQNPVIVSLLLPAPVVALTQVTPLATGSSSRLHQTDPQTPQGLKYLFKQREEPLPPVSAHRGGTAMGFSENCITTSENALSRTFAILALVLLVGCQRRSVFQSYFWG